MMESEEQNYTTEMKNRDSKKYENLHSDDSGGQKSHPVSIYLKFAKHMRHHFSCGSEMGYDFQFPNPRSRKVFSQSLVCPPLGADERVYY